MMTFTKSLKTQSINMPFFCQPDGLAWSKYEKLSESASKAKAKED